MITRETILEANELIKNGQYEDAFMAIASEWPDDNSFGDPFTPEVIKAFTDIMAYEFNLVYVFLGQKLFNEDTLEPFSKPLVYFIQDINSILQTRLQRLIHSADEDDDDDDDDEDTQALQEEYESKMEELAEFMSNFTTDEHVFTMIAYCKRVLGDVKQSATFAVTYLRDIYNHYPTKFEVAFDTRKDQTLLLNADILINSNNGVSWSNIALFIFSNNKIDNLVEKCQPLIENLSENHQKSLENELRQFVSNILRRHALNVTYKGQQITFTKTTVADDGDCAFSALGYKREEVRRSLLPLSFPSHMCLPFNTEIFNYFMMLNKEEHEKSKESDEYIVNQMSAILQNENSNTNNPEIKINITKMIDNLLDAKAQFSALLTTLANQYPASSFSNLNWNARMAILMTDHGRNPDFINAQARPLKIRGYLMNWFEHKTVVKYYIDQITKPNANGSIQLLLAFIKVKNNGIGLCIWQPDGQSSGLIFKPENCFGEPLHPQTQHLIYKANGNDHISHFDRLRRTNQIDSSIRFSAKNMLLSSQILFKPLSGSTDHPPRRVIKKMRTQ